MRIRALLLALGLTAGLRSQDPFDLARPFVRTYGVETGLPGGTVYNLAMDGQGILWAATQEGAARFDGVAWTPVRPPGAKGPVRAILHASDGALWLGTESSGLWRLAGGRWTQFEPGVGVNHLVETREVQPGIWAATRGQGLLRWDGASWSRAPGLPAQWLWRPRERAGPDGVTRLWVGARNFGLWALGPEGWRRMAEELPYTEFNGPELGLDEAGRPVLWVGSWGEGLVRWDGRHWSRLTGAQALPSRLPTSALVHQAEAPGGPVLWAGTADRGLAWYQGGRWRTLEHDFGTEIPGAICALPGRGAHPTLWFGTFSRGVAAVDLSAWRTLDARSGLPWEHITAMAEGAEGLWVGTTKGLVHLVGDKVIPEVRPGAPRSRITGIMSEPDEHGRERLWVGTDLGIEILEGGRWKSGGPPGGPPEGQPCGFLRTAWNGGSQLWVGTGQGVARLEGGRWRLYTPKEGAPSQWTTPLCDSPDPVAGPALWLASRNGAVVRFQGDRWSTFAPPGHPNAWCSDLLTTTGPDGRRWLWAAFVGDGLGRLEIGREEAGWRLWTPANLPGLPTASIFKMLRDGSGRFYLGTSRGVVRLRMEDQGEGPVPAGLEVFTEGDGLPSPTADEFARLVDRRGRVWMGTDRGLAVLDPALEAPSETPSLPFFDRVEVDGNALPVREGLRLGHRQKSFRLDFLWPIYHRREDARFRTQLAGFEPEPGPWRPEAYRDFTGLPPGRYTLLLWARDAGGRVVGPLRWTFQTLPAPWATWWAWSLYALAVVGLGAYAVRYRTALLQAQAQALEATVAARTRDLAEAMQVAESARTVAELEREDARLARRQAEDAAQAKSDFLANMSHEIRTPINAIAGFSHLGLRLEAPAKALEYFQKISTASHSLLGIINDILDFSKIEAGKLELEATPFQLAKVLANVADLFAPRASEKDIELVLDLDTAAPPALVGDPLRLGQVLTNLVSNAVKFTDHGQVVIRVTLEARDAAGARLRFSVQDSGIGISLGQMQRLFQAFQQADSSTSRRFGGTGLGLIISRRLVTLMGGEIQVESDPGRGSTFSFSAAFPVPDMSSVPVMRALHELHGAAALVVDDNAVSRNVLAEQLKVLGLVPHAVGSGVEALAELARPGATYALVLLDWRMPGMDGLETARRIREQAPDRPPPTLVMASAFAQEEIQREAALVGAAAFLAKPVTLPALQAALLQALGLLRAPEGRDARGPDREARRLRGTRLLLVEDNPINQEVAREILAGAGAAVTVAGSGVEALRRLARDTFDAVLMDIQMPDMDGYEATTLIRERSDLTGLPVIAMTAHAMAGYREQCLAAGMNDYVTKPIDPEALFEVLERWVGRWNRAGGPDAKPEAPRPAQAPVPVPVPGPEPAPPPAPALDYAAGLRRLMGKEPLYRRLLADFARDHADSGPRLRALLEAGDRGAAEQLTHLLHGLAGNLSLTTVAAAAGALEAALRSGTPIPETPLAPCETALAQALEAVRALPAEAVPDAPPPAPAPQADLSGLLADLDARLARQDPSAEDALPALEAQLGPAAVADLRARLEAYDFKGAREALGRVKG